jgi:prepilin-type N-terminal cleavage/methylation domain-containing protein
VTRAVERGEAGFTLMEILVSLIVMVIGLTGVIMMQNMVYKGNRLARDSNRAAAMAADLLEEARTRTDLGVMTLPYELVYEETEILGVTYRPRLTITEHPEIDNLVWIEVEVTFDEEDGSTVAATEHAARLMLLRTRTEVL